MIFNRVCAAIFIVSMLYASHSLAAEPADDTPAREAAIDRYFLLVPFTDMANEMSIEVAKQLPPEQRAEFIDMMKNEVRWDQIQSAAKASMVKNFSLAEIQALTDFMNRPEGKSVMAKMKFYMADVMPIIQSEMKRVVSAHQAPAKSK